MHDADAIGARADVGAALALHCGGTVGAGGEVDGRLLLNDGHAVAIGRIGPAGPCATWTWPEPSPAAFAWPTAATLTSCVRILQVPVAPWSAWSVHLRGSLYLDVRALVQHQAAIASADGAGVLLAGHPHGTLFAAVEDDASFRAA